ncbi:ferritin-like domain-containing protein [Coprinopsis sp. MPI-PUGE-AT-0042]|nr:ferritin-like domain-containing protein [Coprinopsis sp. MPI-PUGE-AT-0042]
MKLYAYLSSLILLSPLLLAAAQHTGGSDGPGQNDVNDLQALNFALHITNLASSFYAHMFDTLSEEDFITQGTPYWVRRRYIQVKDHNEGQRTWLQNAITAAGGTPVDACEYAFTFPNNTTSEALKVSEAIQQIATSGLAGLLKYVENRDYVKALASMYAVKARHTSWTMSAVRSQGPWGTAFELQLNITAGEPYQLQFDNSAFKHDSAGPLLATFLYGTGRIVVPVHGSANRAIADDSRVGQILPLVPGTSDESSDYPQAHDEISQEYWVKIPLDVEGQGGVYVFLTQGTGDENTIAGPTLLSFPWDPVSNGEHGGVVALLGYNMFVL